MVHPLRAAHRFNHFSTAKNWRHRHKVLVFPIEKSHTSRAAHFVTGSNQEVHVQVLHVNRHMRNRLTGVHQNKRPATFGHQSYLFDWVDCACTGRGGAVVGTEESKVIV